MFQVENSWESHSNVEVLRTLFERPGLKRYPLVELSANVQLLHVNLLFKGDGVELDLWQRFICCDLVSVADLIENEDVEDIKIYMQTALSRDKPFVISEIVEFSRFSVDDQTCGYSCLCKNGSRLEQHAAIEIDPAIIKTHHVFPRSK